MTHTSSSGSFHRWARSAPATAWFQWSWLSSYSHRHSGRFVRCSAESGVDVEQVVRQHGQQEVLQQRAGERHVDVRLQQLGDFAGEDRLLQAGVPEARLVDHLRLPRSHGCLRAGGDDEHLALPRAEHGERLLHGLRLRAQADERRIDVLQQLDRQSSVGLDDTRHLLGPGPLVLGALDEPRDRVRQRGQRHRGRQSRERDSAQRLFAEFGPIHFRHSFQPIARVREEER